MFRHNDDRQLEKIEYEYQEESDRAVKDNDKVIARAPSSVCALHAAEYNLCACTEN